MKKTVLIGVLIFACLFFGLHRGWAQKNSPFGVCLHLEGGNEFVQMPHNLLLAKNAGIEWIRVDFSWGGIESPQGIWHFDHIDKMVSEANKTGLQVLAPLLYDRPWARPVYEHLDAWLLYVEKAVTRYKGKVGAWEVWNEPNLYPRFWDKREDGENYTKLLKATYEKIKSIDPNALVLHSGTAGIPLSYIEKSFAAGSGKYFDKMAVHPYRPLLNSWEATKRYKDDIDNLRALMAKFNLGDKDIWFTEMGISSMASVATRGKNVFHETMAETGKNWRVAVVCDDEFRVQASFTAKTVRDLFPAEFKLDTIQLLDIRQMDMNAYDALFFPPSEHIPFHVSQVIAPRLNRYMIGGGKIYHYTGGNIYYYGNTAIKETGQAHFAAQTILLSLRFDVEKYFWYEMESPAENLFEREDNFGLTRRGLGTKQAYWAYSTIGKLYPEGSKIDTSVEWRQKDYCVVSWTQPGGIKVWAIWAPEGNHKVNVRIGKGLKQALNCTGGALEITEASTSIEVSADVTYLAGPATLDIK